MTGNSSLTIDLALKLGQHYRKVLADLESEESEDRRYQIMVWTGTKYGICRCSEKLFNTDLRNCEWIKSRCRKIDSLIPGLCDYPNPNNFRESFLTRISVLDDFVREFRNSKLEELGV